MKRRTFVASVAIIPFAGRLVPAAETAAEPERIILMTSVTDRHCRGVIFPVGTLLERNEIGQYALPDAKCGDVCVGLLDNIECWINADLFCKW